MAAALGALGALSACGGGEVVGDREPRAESVLARPEQCDLGQPIGERALIRPREGTGYSVDALNPDVVRRGGTYHLYFSGNQAEEDTGEWHTYFATSRSPTGPFRVTDWEGDSVNGGTAVWRGRLYQARTLNDGGADLAVSDDGSDWRTVTSIPQDGVPGTPYRLTADYALERAGPGLRLWFLGRSDPGGFSGAAASLDLRGREWANPATAIEPGTEPWEDADIGEPYAFTLRGRHYLLYTATSAATTVRSIGLAVQGANGEWRRCGREPVIRPGAPWGSVVSIDPSALVVGDRLHIYYGGGSNKSIGANLDGAIGVRTYRVDGR